MGTSCSCFKYTVKGSGSQTPKVFADQVYDIDQKKYQDAINADLLQKTEDLLQKTEDLESALDSFREITESEINSLF